MLHRAITVDDAPVASGNYSQAIGAGGPAIRPPATAPYDPETRKSRR